MAAVTDAYLTLQEFKDRVNSSSSDDDAVISVCLTAASRFIDRECNRFFTIDSAVQTRRYNGGEGITSFALFQELVMQTVRGNTVLYLPDDIATTTGLVVKVDLDGDYTCEQTLTLDTHFWVGPYNAALGPEPEPYNMLEIKPENGLLTIWPEHKRSIEVTAKFGWPAVPSAVKEATALLARMFLDMEESGHLLTVQRVEEAVQLDPRVGNVLERLKKAYGRTPPKRLFA